MLTISTLPEALDQLKKATGREWTDSEIFDVATTHGIKLSAAAPITSQVIIQRFTFDEGLKSKSIGSPGHVALAILYPWQVGQLWISGETLTKSPDNSNLPEPEEDEYISFKEDIRVTRESVRLRAEALNRIVKIWRDGQSGRWTKDAAAPDGMRYHRGPEWIFPLPAGTPSTAPTAPEKEVGSADEKSASEKTNKLRRNCLDPAIDKAINQAGNMEPADVYLQLKGLAIEEEKPFTGIVEGGALCYTNDNDEPAIFTKSALRKRLKNRK